MRAELERSAFAPVLGNPEGSITLTEFFDYRCPICRTVPVLLSQLSKDDSDLRIVLREWPVLRPESKGISQVSLACLKQGKYWQFHHAMFTRKGRSDQTAALRLADEIGADMARLTREMDGQDVIGHIELSWALGEHIGLSGTPSFIAGNRALFGRNSLASLKTFINNARSDLE